jgi:prepilin-type N-terminal cleavage/methylation domain-containing protein
MKTRIRRGFTLPEILVTVTIVAVLAAVVVPAVTQSVNKGNAPATQQDVTQIRSSITAFLTDVRKYPRYLTQLNTAITTADSDVTGATYTATDSAAWKGPYFSSAVTTANGFTSPGLGLQIVSALKESGSWITDSIAAPTTCVALLQLDTLFDKGDGNSGGAIVWNSGSGSCAQGTPAGTMTGRALRLIPKT